MQEKRTSTRCQQDFTAADLDYFFRQLDQALALAGPGQENTYYVSWSLGGALDHDSLEEWLKRIGPYVESGQVDLKMLSEMYDAYIYWEGNY